MSEYGQEINLGRLIDRIGRFTRGLQYVDGLSPTQWEVLRFLARANRYSCNPSALSDFLGSTKGTVSQTLIALEGKGYVRRVRVDRDRRAVRLDLTEAGRTRLRSDPLTRLDLAAMALAPELRAALASGLGSLLRDLESRQCGGRFGVCVECGMFRGDDAGDDLDGPHRCGLTGEPIDEGESRRLCTNYQA